MNNDILANPRLHPDNANLPNINQPETIIGLTVTFLSLAITALSLRLWVRIRDNLWGWDDAFILLAGLSSGIADCFVCLMPAGGLGLHLWTLSADRLADYFKHVYITNLAYCSAAAFIKLAILFQYLRLFAEAAQSTTSAQYLFARRITIALITVSSMWGVAFSLLATFPCSPISKDWHPQLDGTCVGWGSKDPDKFFAMFVGHSASNMALDLMVLMVPIPFLSMLRIAGKSKAGLIALFTLGILVCAVSIGRLISMCINRAGTIPILDMPYHTPTIYILSVLEVNVAIIAGSIPIFWPVISNLATNKIWVVNEIEVRVEETYRGSVSTNGDIGLTDQGSWSKLDSKDEYGGHTKANRLSVVTKYDRPDTTKTKHSHKASNTSSLGRTMGLEFARPSQDSQRNLCRIPSGDLADSNNSLVRSEGNDWFAHLDRKTNTSMTTTSKRKTDISLQPINKMER